MLSSAPSRILAESGQSRLPFLVTPVPKLPCKMRFATPPDPVEICAIERCHQNLSSWDLGYYIHKQLGRHGPRTPADYPHACLQRSLFLASNLDHHAARYL